LIQSQSTIELKPKCVSYKEPALTAEGFFLPCCWCDRRNKYFKEKGFLNPELNISNVDDIVSEIFNSQIWIDFFNEIQHNGDYPSVCKEHCGVNIITNKKIKK
jgi:hypothetical protein